jgi:TonB family protein
MVSINRDGSLYEVLVLESSGQPLLDQAAQRIVRLAAPFAPFTGDLAEFDRLEIIRTWRFARGDACPQLTAPITVGAAARKREPVHLAPRWRFRGKTAPQGNSAVLGCSRLVCPAWRHTSAMKTFAPATSSTSS